MARVGAGKRLAGSGLSTTTGKRAGIVISLSGHKAIESLLDQLEPRLQKKHMRRAMRDGMKIVQAKAKALAPVGKSRQTRKAIKVRALKSRKRGVLGIDVRIGKGDYVGDQFYASFVEFGTLRMRARPFLRPAYHQAGPAAKATTLRALWDALEKEVRSLRRANYADW